MTAYSVAAKRRARKARQDLDSQLGLGPIKPHDQPRHGGKFVARDDDSAGDPQKTALEARARHEGRDTTRQDREAVRAAHSASGVGRAIRATFASERDSHEKAMEALQAWTHYSAAMRTNRRRVYGKSITAKTAKIEMEPEPFQTRDDDRPDDRTEDEKHRDAVNARARWDAALSQLSGRDRWLIERSLYAECAEWWDPLMHCPTRDGYQLARALYELADLAD